MQRSDPSAAGRRALWFLYPDPILKLDGVRDGTATVVPEPASAVLLLLGVIAASLLRRLV